VLGPYGECGGNGKPTRVDDDPAKDNPCRIDKEGDDPEADTEAEVVDDKVFPLNGLILIPPLVAVFLLIGTAPGDEEREDDGYGYGCGDCCEYDEVR
jgi:hypothetical protein